MTILLGREIDVADDGDEGDIITEVSGVVVRVDDHRLDQQLHMTVELGGSVHVPLPYTNLEVHRVQAVATDNNNNNNNMMKPSVIS